MNFQEKSTAEVRQALTDANCDEETIQKFMHLRAQGRDAEALRLLSCYRCHLVCAMHEAQKPLDVLDYLIYQLEKENNE